MSRRPHRSYDSLGRKIFIITALFVLGAAAGLESMLLAAPGGDMSVFAAYFSSPLLVVLNLLPPVLLMLLLYYLFGRAWAAVSITVFVVTVLSVINYLKLSAGAGRLVPADLLRFRELGGYFAGLPSALGVKLYIAAGFLVVSILISVLLMSGDLPDWWVRLIGVVVAAAVCCGLYMYVYESEAVYSSAGAAVTEQSGEDSARGLIYPFIRDAGSEPAREPGEGV